MWCEFWAPFLVGFFGVPCETFTVCSTSDFVTVQLSGSEWIAVECAELTKELRHRDAVAIAYVVDDETLFRRATEYALVSLGKEQWDQDIRGGLDAIIPKTLLGKCPFPALDTCIALAHTTLGSIKNKRSITLSALEKAAYRSVTAIHDKVTSLEPCAGAMEKLATYTLQMCHIKDGAYDLAATGMSLCDVWDGLEAAVECLPETTKKCNKSCEGGCAVDVRDVLIKAIEESKEGVQGLCLRCEKEQVGANEDGVVECVHEVED
jgi:hypothetical protein